MQVENDERSPEVTPVASSSCEPVLKPASECSPVSVVNVQFADTVERGCVGEHSNSTSPITFRELISDPATATVPRRTGRKRKAGHACIITTSPYKKSIQEARDRKTEKERKQEEQKVRAESKKLERAMKQKMKQDTRKGSCGKKRHTSRTPFKRSKKVTVPTEPENSVMNTCSNCGFSYGEAEDPLIDDTWSQCITCHHWCHDSCGTAGGFGFVCAACE